MISIVIPVYNEEGLIEELFSKTSTVFTSVNENFEVILVDDGSSDGTTNYRVHIPYPGN